MSVWSHAIAVVASVKVVWALLALALAPRSINAAPDPFSPWIHLVEATIFGSLGALLLVAKGTDRRTGWLGGTLLLIAAPFADAVLRRIALTTGSAYFGDMVRVDAFLPLFFWMFLRDFPQSAMSGRVGIPAWLATLSMVTGSLLFVTNLSYLVWPSASWPFDADLRAVFFAGNTSASYYWPVILGLTTPGLPFLLWCARTSAPDERRRVSVFVGGLLAGCGPISIEVLLEAFVPSYRRFTSQPQTERVIAFAIYALLAAVPFVTAYSVLVDRVVGLRFVLRAALQYALARYTMLAALAIPFAAWGVYLFEHRNESIAAMLSGPRPLALIIVLAVGLAMFRVRRRALDALDRRFFREHYDTRQILSDLIQQSVSSESARELAAHVAHEVNRALHLHSITLFVVDEDGANVQSLEGEGRPLATSSGLGIILAGDSAPLDIDLHDERSPLNRLPDEERYWLADGGFLMLVPLIAADRRLLGVLGLGEKRSGLPFSSEDRQLLRALAASLTLALDNRRLRSSPTQRIDAAARECVDCRTVHPPEAFVCTCGGRLMSAVAPHTIRGAFRLDRRIGSGGMGVVYRARDLALDRIVAIKTLPRVSPEEAAYLRREARAMAALSHPNLAVIFGAETWHGTPLLVVEYLGGGTLADRLQRRTSTQAEIIDLGLTLTDALEYIHGVGILHCDIKPANIGFTTRHVPKLLDFGLAHIFLESQRRSANATTTGVASSLSDVKFDQWSVVSSRFAGTPLYMSPEAINGRAPSPSFDLWSLAVVLYEALAGANPFAARSLGDVYEKITKVGAPDLRTFRADLPAYLAEFFAEALALDFKRRPATATALRQRLSALRVTALMS